MDKKEKLTRVIHSAMVGLLGSAKAMACCEYIADAIINSGVLDGGEVDADKT